MKAHERLGKAGTKWFSALALLVVFGICACRGQDEAQRAFEDAKRLAKEGDYEGALAKHIWFHDHALEIRPSFSGVRLSFALSDWIELGKKYPKALEKLTSIRDNKTARLLRGEADRELFNDVEAINQYLGQTNATVTLFKRLDATNTAFASSIYELAEDALVQAEEYALAKKHLGDPRERLAAARQGFERGMEYVERAKRTATVGDSDSGAAPRRAFEAIFTHKVVRIITVLLKTGDKAGAREIQNEALKILDNESIRSAVKD